MAAATPAVEASVLLRRRLCDAAYVFAPFKSFPDSNYSKLKFIISSSITEACNNSVLLLGPRGSGKTAVLELVLEDLKAEFPDMISVIKLNGLLHSDDNCGIKEIARQLCLDHGLLFSKMASSDDNTRFLTDMLRECGLAHKTIIFALDEFDLFSQGKQRLLYGLLDAMQSLTSQAVVIGISCRLDADQLLEKRVRSRFSHRKLLFVPPSEEDLQRLVEHILYVPTDCSFPKNFVKEFNSRLHNILCDKKFKDILSSLSNVDNSISNLLKFIFCAVSSMCLESGFLSLDNFKSAISRVQRQPKLENIQKYRAIQDAYKTSDYRGQNVCLRAFEHLCERELISFTDSRRGSLSIEFRPVRLLVSSHELHQGLKSYHSCPVECL